MGAIGLVVGLASALSLSVAPAQATNVGNEGCTPGYWKNHTDNWFEGLNTGPIATSTTLGSVNLVPAGHSKFNATFLEALNYQGGPRVEGAEQILLRAAVAAWLNAAHEGLGYPLQRAEFVPQVRAAIASGDRDTMLALATRLDNLNNSREGCPLN